jgi:hypothetical protein
MKRVRFLAIEMLPAKALAKPMIGSLLTPAEGIMTLLTMLGIVLLAQFEAVCQFVLAEPVQVKFASSTRSE